MKKVVAILGLVLLGSTAAYATPSTQIWIPSTDIQAYKKVHFGFDTYIKTESNPAGTEPTVNNFGLTMGVLPTEKVQMEVGIDYRDLGASHQYPMYYNAKVGAAEGALFTGSPAFAVGGYEFGTKSNATDYNIIYGLAAKTFGKLGRISVGYFQGNDVLLKDANGNPDEAGLLFSWDRTLSEISEKLWAAIDYMGTDSSYGALSFGVAWSVADNVGLILGYDIFNDDVTYKPTATVQVDMDF
ncbi:MAG TPA: hypothetical protein DCO77_06815 [Nitrospiraceae bacterium]|nr:hypothetical protein [Nitrospiraceae bacterium]